MWELCCTAKLETRAVAAGDLGSSYSKTRQKGVVLPVHGAALGQGWQTEGVCGMAYFPLEAWSTMVGLEELGKK